MAVWGELEGRLHDFYFCGTGTQKRKARMLLQWLIDAWEHDEDILVEFATELRKYEDKMAEEMR